MCQCLADSFTVDSLDDVLSWLLHDSMRLASGFAVQNSA